MELCEKLPEEEYAALKAQAETAARELLAEASLRPGQIVIVGCSSSEILGRRIGHGSSLNAAEAVFEGLQGVFGPAGVHLAAQCCEHLNRAVILPRAAVQPWQPIVNVLPQPKAGGSFATTAFARLPDAVALETVQADAGLDIGGTLIGMHLKPVAVPVRLSLDHIGSAILLCARTRPKFIGGSRAAYQQGLL